MEYAYKLKREYSASGVPVFIADGELKIVWKNGADSIAAGGYVPDLGESAGFIFDGGIPVTGLVLKEIDGEVCTFNVIRTYDNDSGNSYYIIELIGSGKPGGTVPAEAVRGYIGYICSRLKTAAADITSVTDRLFDDISAGTFNAERAAEGFDRIYEKAAMLEREIAYPDRIYSLTDPKKPDDIIILDKEMAAVAAEIKGSLIRGSERSADRRVRISEDYDRDIFFRMNADSFETAVASMTSECCCGGRYPERIIFSARRSGRNRAEITVMSLDTGSEGSTTRSPRGCGEERSFNKKLLSEYIYDVLSLKNGARFSKENIPGGTVCRMNIEALPRGASVSAEKPVDGLGRRREISDKIAFFFGDIPETEKRHYTSMNVFKNEYKPEGLDNIYREDIENERSEV